MSNLSSKCHGLNHTCLYKSFTCRHKFKFGDEVGKLECKGILPLAVGMSSALHACAHMRTPCSSFFCSLVQEDDRGGWNRCVVRCTSCWSQTWVARSALPLRLHDGCSLWERLRGATAVQHQALTCRSPTLTAPWAASPFGAHLVTVHPLSHIPSACGTELYHSHQIGLSPVKTSHALFESWAQLLFNSTILAATTSPCAYTSAPVLPW